MSEYTISHDQHIPGPWEILRSIDKDDGEELIHVGTVERWHGLPMHIAQISGWGGDYDADPRRRGNARLIAAAPALLAALEELTAFVGDAVIAGALTADEMDDNGLLTDAWAAIEKASR